MKQNFAIERELINQMILSIPVVNSCEIRKTTDYGFILCVELDDGYSFDINVYVLKEAYPIQIQKVIDSKNTDEMHTAYKFIVAPFVSETSYLLCKKENIGVLDFAGNCLIKYYSIYVSVSGKRKVFVPRRALKSIFEKSSIVSSKILRTLLNGTNKIWTLKELSNEVQCSIGQVYKVKDFLLKNTWIEVTPDGIRIIDVEAIMIEWREVYANKDNVAYECYSLDDPADFERKLEKMKNECGIEYYLTGFSGGVRYTPVVRYNKIHVYIAAEDVKEAIAYLGCKQVDSGSNISLLVPYHECVLSNNRRLNSSYVVSPVQVYLDCMQLKGNGEELAQAILIKEII